MAVAAVTVTVNKAFKTGRVIRAYGTIAIAPAADTYATGGLTVDFTGKVASSKAPLDVNIKGESGFEYRWDKGSSIANGKVLVFGQEPTNAGAGVLALTEHAAAAVAAGVSGDTINFTADFDALL